MARPSSRLVALFLAVLAVAMAAPGTVFAQGPGDDQYTDPFGELPEEEPAGGGDPPPQEQPPAPPPSSNTVNETATTTGPPSTDVAPEPIASETVTETAGAAELARTGLPADFLAVLGLGLLCSGVLLRIGLLSLGGRSAAHPFGGHSVLQQAPRVPGTSPRRR